MTKFRFIAGEKTDERLQVTQETLSTIKIIKMYTWERFFGNRITESRRFEQIYYFLEKYLNIFIFQNRNAEIIASILFQGLHTSPWRTFHKNWILRTSHVIPVVW